MKLKYIISTLIAAGAVSANAFADDAQMQSQIDTMQAKIAQLEAQVNTTSNSATTGTTSSPTWFNNIHIGGMLNADANATSGYAPTNFTTDHPSNLGITNANLFVDANVSDWTSAHLGLVYSQKNADFSYLRAGAFTPSQENSSTGLYVDEAYATIGNFAKSPFYARVGQQYLPFGSYQPYADMTTSVTQLLSEVNAPSALVGFVANNGVNGSLYALQGLPKATTPDGVLKESTNGHAIRNFGASLGYNTTMNNVGVNLGLDYLYNMADVTAIRYPLSYTPHILGIDLGENGYIDAVGGVAMNAGIKFNAFDASAKYVSALKRFNTADVSYVENDATVVGARPSAWALDAGYSFPVLAHNSRASLGYQGTRQAADLNLLQDEFSTTVTELGLPKTRYLADYTVNVSKYTDLGFEVRHDVDYGTANGGTGNSTNTGTVRLSVKFA